MRIRLAIIFWLVSVSSHAQSIEVVIGPPTGPAAIGTRMVFPIYFINNGENPALTALPDQLVCRLSSKNESLEILARRVTPSDRNNVTLEAKASQKVLYTLQLPASIKGSVHLKLPELTPAAMMFDIDTSEPSFAEEADRKTPDPKTGDRPVDLSTFINVYQPYARNISFYHPMYFLVGTDPKNSKFQFSFKYRIFNPAKPMAQQHPWVEGIHFAYTQTSFWDLASDSKPFEDTSYKPEFFFQTNNLPTGIDWLKGCFVQAGLQHESNGFGGEESRSTNFAYIEPSFILMNEKNLTGLKISPHFHLYINNDDETNTDLADYRGYWDLRLTFGKADRFIVDSRLRWADAGGSAQIDVTYPLHRLFQDNVDLYLQIEYVNALAENLLHYSERTEAIRIGIAIVR